MSGRVVVEIRDRTGSHMGLLRGWDGLEWVDRYGDVGSGKVDCPANGWNRELVQAGAIVAVRDEDGVLQSGPLPEFGEESGEQSVLKLTWKNTHEWMRRRLCYPDPWSPIGGGGRLARASDDRKGATSSVIAGYVDMNLGPNALPNRRLPGLTMGRDDGTGVVLNAPVQARFNNLLDLSRQLAVTGGVGFSIDTVDRSYVFNTWQVADLSSDVVFSAQTHGLQESLFTVTAPGATSVIAGGDGEDAERVFAEVQSADSLADESVWGRIEVFRDDRSADEGSLTAGALRDLAEKGATVAAEFTPTNRALVYGRDYRLGDLVTCVLRPGFSVVKPVREVMTSVTMSGGRVVKPVAGDYGATAVDGSQFQTRELIRVVDALKRNR